MKISVYIATSLDGFIARSDGGLDWLQHNPGERVGGPDPFQTEPDIEDYGFNAFFQSIDTLVMGRGTYEFVADTGQWIYEGKRPIVLSSTLSEGDIAKHLSGKLEVLSAEPSDLVKKLEAEGAARVYIDGGVTIQRFLRAGLVDELIVSRMPVLLGSGIPLFGELSTDVLFDHLETRGYSSGLVQSKYAARR